MVNVYILLLEHKKFYIGKTTNPKFRIEQHFAANGSSWTKKYKPVSVVEVIPDCDEYDEDKHTIKYMEKYGINVRGGSFCENNNIKEDDEDYIGIGGPIDIFDPTGRGISGDY